MTFNNITLLTTVLVYVDRDLLLATNIYEYNVQLYMCVVRWDDLQFQYAPLEKCSKKMEI